MSGVYPANPAWGSVNAETLAAMHAKHDADPEAFWREHGIVPVNHMVTVRRDLAQSRPDVIPELVRLFREAKAAAPTPSDNRDPYPSGRAALEPALRLALRYTAEQGLLPHRFNVADIWEGLPAGS